MYIIIYRYYIIYIYYYSVLYYYLLYYIIILYINLVNYSIIFIKLLNNFYPYTVYDNWYVIIRRGNSMRCLKKCTNNF